MIYNHYYLISGALHGAVVIILVVVYTRERKGGVESASAVDQNRLGNHDQ